MRIQTTRCPQGATGRHVLTKAFLTLSMTAAALGLAACSAKEEARPESRLGAGPRQDGYRWNGNGRRTTYDSKSLDAPGQGRANGSLGSSESGDTVLFASDSTDLSPEAKAILDGYIAQLRQKSVRTLSIEGHADERGTREYNIALGARRAATVKSYLVSKGIFESQIKTISYGKERPVATCDDISCWARNRRAQLIVGRG